MLDQNISVEGKSCSSNSSDWAFNLRSRGVHYDSDDSDSETEDKILITNKTTNLSEDAQLLKDLDISSRQETVEYKANPWNIAKINAASRPKPQPPTATIKHAKQPFKKKPEGRIVDSFKRQAERPQPASLVTALKPGAPILPLNPQVSQLSSPALNSAAEDLPSNSLSRSHIASHLSRPAVYRQSAPSPRFPAVFPQKNQLPYVPGSRKIDRIPVQSHSSPIPAHYLRRTAQFPSYTQPTTHTSLSFSSPTHCSDRYVHPHSSPARPTYENSRFIAKPSGSVLEGFDMNGKVAYMHSGRGSTGYVSDMNGYSESGSHAYPSHTPNVNKHKPSDILPGSTETGSRSRRFQSPLLRHEQCSPYASLVEDHCSPTASVPAPNNTMPGWLASAIPLRPPSQSKYIAESHLSGLYGCAPPDSPSLDTRHLSRTDSRPFKRRQSPSLSPSPAPASVARSWAPQPPVTTRSRKIDHDAYAFSPLDPDTEWSTLPSRKKAPASKSKTKAIKHSGKFRLPLNLFAAGGAGVKNENVESRDKGAKKSRVITYMPPPRAFANPVSIPTPVTPRREPNGGVGKVSPVLTKAEEELYTNDEPPSSIGFSPFSPKLGSPAALRPNVLQSSPQLIRSSPTLISSSPPDVRLDVDLDSIIKNYPATHVTMSERRLASIQVWDLLDLDSCVPSAIYRDSETHTMTVASGDMSKVEYPRRELTIVLWGTNQILEVS